MSRTSRCYCSLPEDYGTAGSLRQIVPDVEECLNAPFALFTDIVRLEVRVALPGRPYFATATVVS